MTPESNTASRPRDTASVQVLLGSNGAGTSGLGVFALPTQNVPISGMITGVVGTLAIAGPATPNPVNFGNVRVGDAAPSQVLSISNLAVAPAEGLNATIGTFAFAVRGQIGGPPGPVPDSPLGLIGALTLLGTLALGHRHRRATATRRLAS